ncbi:hypothetical protein ACXR0O_13510 [Verrucomicrobiota bacterium sgz303538]
MRFAFAPIRLLPVLCVAGALFTAPDSKAAESDTADFFAKRVSQLDNISIGETPADTTSQPRRRSRGRTPANQQTKGLAPATLQTDTNLHSTARGLTPAEDWRSTFPSKSR